MHKVSENYIRVGTVFYKISRSSEKKIKLQKWSKEAIILDHESTKDRGAKNLLREIAKYDDFVNVPSHLDYKAIIGNSYNLYAPFLHTPQAGDYENSLNYIRHIFGEQYELGLDYMKILFEKPTQILPILLLVSEDRNTGKSTFWKWLRIIFEGNIAIATNENFSSNFNSDWSGKLLIALDEGFIEKQAIAEKLKFLSTTNAFNAESKGIDRKEVDFFGKFIICSNNEKNVLPIDKNEVRFWVRKVPKFEIENPHLLDSLEKEIPAFLSFLLGRKMSTTHQTRMWFTPEQLKTNALEKVIEHSRGIVEKELETVILEHLEDFELEEVCLTVNDLIHLLKDSYIKANKYKIQEVLRQWGHPTRPNPNRYKKWYWRTNIEGGVYKDSETVQGRCFIFKIKDLKKENS